MAFGAIAGSVALPGQRPAREVTLVDGRVWSATEIAGDPERGYDAVVAGSRHHIEPDELLLVQSAAARRPELPSLHFPDGDVVHGSVVGGDAAGNQIELLSPVLGRLAVPVDRIAALAAASVRDPLRLLLPDGVGEAVFLRASVGYDVLAGSLHRCGERGVLFAPDGKEPSWYAPEAFVALRIADPSPRRRPAGVNLATRTGDRLGIALQALTPTGLRGELDSGDTIELRLEDLACLSFLGAGTFLSDLQPSAVEETGFDAEVLHPFCRDLSVLGDPLVVAGRAHGKGLGVHSRSRLVFRVPPGTAYFWTRVGLDDSSPTLGVAALADVRVLIDGTARFEQRALGAGPAKDTGLLAVQPGQEVTLEVDFGPGRDIGDRIDWLSPVFLPARGRRP